MTNKCAFERRGYMPGQHGPNVKARRNKASDFSMQLREKQKMRRIYGVLEAQFRRYFGMALKTRGVTGSELLVLLERRLDNVIYRMGWAPSRAAARQIVSHAHLDINGHPIDVPSYLVKPGDKITVREVSRKLNYFKTLMGDKESPIIPGWLNSDRAALTAQINHLPKREDIEVPLKEQLVVEYYSR
jgi:small subunit ribosomal protein S4